MVLLASQRLPVGSIYLSGNFVVVWCISFSYACRQNCVVTSNNYVPSGNISLSVSSATASLCIYFSFCVFRSWPPSFLPPASLELSFQFGFRWISLVESSVDMGTEITLKICRCYSLYSQSKTTVRSITTRLRYFYDRRPGDNVLFCLRRSLCLQTCDFYCLTQ